MAVARRALEPSDPNKIGVVGLASLIFFAVAGSPAGTEDTIVAAGPLLALLGFVFMPVVWAVPESLVTAELATAFPHNGGYVVWVTRAFGPTTGFVVGILKYFANVLDNCAYPVMMLNYFRQLGGTALESDTAARVFLAGVTTLLSAAQWRGLEIVGMSSAAVLVVTLIPFVILVVVGIGKVEWGRLGSRREAKNIDWALYLQTLFWNLNYWDAVSTVASEVENPSRTFPRALGIAGVSVVSMYILVLGVAIGNLPEDVEWNNSELADAGLYVAGPWLQISIVVSVAISAAGLFLADLSTGIFMLDGMADLGMLPEAFSWKNRRGVPVIGFFLQILLVFGLVQLVDSLEDIISYEMVSYCFSQVIEFAAFVRLRQTCVDVERPYMALGGNGTWKAIALVTPAVLFTIAVMFFSSGAVWLSAAIQVALSLGLAVGLFRLRRSRPRLFRSPYSDVPNYSIQRWNDAESESDDVALIETDLHGNNDTEIEPCTRTPINSPESTTLA
eukprot:m.110257 g.110257  ORF g.110257 m.110257 type:complete len:503 (+) comp12881_c0_seq3:615-2123(+)